MKQLYIRLSRLIFGLLLYGIGIVFTLNAQIGYPPWDVFHGGMAKAFTMSIGIASIYVGVVIVIISYLLGEKLGLGTLLNMVAIGLFIDLIMRYNIIPVSNHFISGILMMILGLFLIALATYFYIGSGFGAGPRDSLMVAMKRKTGLPIGFCRASIELIAAFVGWRFGGMIGVGTIISAFGIGYCIQITFKLMKFDPTLIDHETLTQTYQNSFVKKAA
jgi:uncharacterized membrane protein YczE